MELYASKRNLNGVTVSTKPASQTMVAHAKLDPPAGSEKRHDWSLQDLAFEHIDRNRVREDETLFYMLVSASFIESGSELYTRNLIEHYSAFPVVQRWLAESWEREELRHGSGLAAYVRAVWPEYDWDAAFRAFFDDYRQVCNAEHLEADRALELAARCTIEMGTASYYRMLHEAVSEPVLRELLDHIRRDEVRHFKHFYRYLRTMRGERGVSRLRLARCVLQRTFEMTRDDGWQAFLHAYRFRNGGRTPTRAEYRAWRKKVREIARAHFPSRMAAEMLITPLDLPVVLRRCATGVAAAVLRRAL
jgi:hypothetical protein